MTADSESAKIEEEYGMKACAFSRTFFDAMDRKREKVNYLITEDQPTLVWNGNAVEGLDNVIKFISTVPETQHLLITVDAQTMDDNLSGLPGCTFVVCAGSVTVGGIAHAFTETLTLILEDQKFKIRSARFRYVD